jgi:hypothetical protein
MLCWRWVFLEHRKVIWKRIFFFVKIFWFRKAWYEKGFLIRVKIFCSLEKCDLKKVFLFEFFQMNFFWNFCVIFQIFICIALLHFYKPFKSLHFYKSFKFSHFLKRFKFSNIYKFSTSILTHWLSSTSRKIVAFYPRQPFGSILCR